MTAALTCSDDAWSDGASLHQTWLHRDGDCAACVYYDVSCGVFSRHDAAYAYVRVFYRIPCYAIYYVLYQDQI